VLVDHRTYRIRPGFVGPYLDLYEKQGFAAQTRHIGQPLAYKRAGMTADPEWQNYLRMNTEAGNLLEQRTCLITPAKFAPIKR